MNLFGYEWSYECPECETRHELSGAICTRNAIINGEEKYRVRQLDEGDTLTCQNCGYESEL